MHGDARCCSYIKQIFVNLKSHDLYRNKEKKIDIYYAILLPPSETGGCHFRVTEFRDMSVISSWQGALTELIACTGLLASLYLLRPAMFSATTLN